MRESLVLYRGTVTDLIGTDYEQLSLFDEAAEELCINLDSRIQTLMSKFSNLSFEQSTTAREYSESIL